MTPHDHLPSSDSSLPEAYSSAFERYLDGTASLGDETAIHDWLAENPAAAHVTSAFLAELEASVRPAGDEVSARAQAIVNSVRVMRESRDVQDKAQVQDARISRGVPKVRVHNYEKKKYAVLPSVRPWTEIAVACLIAVVMGISIFPGARSFFRGSDRNSYEHHTARGQRATLELPDGTQVVLAPESDIRYESNATDERTVLLVGQAHFTVTTDAKRPFRVKTGQTVTQVLGTSFVVRAYQNEPDVQIAVTAGKVSVHNVGHGAVVLPGEVANVSPNGEPAVRRDARFADVLAWLRGELVFEDTPLPIVIAELERVYNVSIQLTSPALDHRRFSGSFVNDPLAVVLESIEFTTNTSVVRDGNTVIITAR